MKTERFFSANQRTAMTNSDNSYWVYQYDNLGQVTSGVKYWNDGTPVAGQQFGYAFDSIGNRQSTAAGGDQSGSNLRSASYSANNLNQYTNRTVPNAVDVMGSATNAATVVVNGQAPLPQERLLPVGVGHRQQRRAGVPVDKQLRCFDAGHKHVFDQH